MTAPSLDKRIKKHIHAQPHELRIVPAPGWKDVCAAEVQEILGSFTQPGKFVASFVEDPEGIGLTQLDFRQLIEIPQRLLTAQACYWTILDRHVGSFGELQKVVDDLDFELYLPAAASVQIKVQSFQSQLYHEGKVYEQLSRIFSAQGLTVRDDAPWQLLAEQRGNRLKLFLALGPYPLHHRHYKAGVKHGAPLQECLAASALHWMMGLQQDWQPDHIVVPFAGSGTLLFEAWLQLASIPAYLWDPPLYLEALPATPPATLQSIRKRLGERMTSELPAALLIEKDAGICQGLDAQLASFKKPLGMDPRVTVLCGDVFRTPLPAAQRILAPLNPPYGLRLVHEGKSRPADFYRELGAFLKKWPTKGQDVRGFVLIPDEACLQIMRQELGASSVQAVQSFSQGGQHIRCMAFRVQSGSELPSS